MMNDVIESQLNLCSFFSGLLIQQVPVLQVLLLELPPLLIGVLMQVTGEPLLLQQQQQQQMLLLTGVHQLVVERTGLDLFVTVY